MTHRMEGGVPRASSAPLVRLVVDAGHRPARGVGAVLKRGVPFDGSGGTARHGGAAGHRLGRGVGREVGREDLPRAGRRRVSRWGVRRWIRGTVGWLGP